MTEDYLNALQECNENPEVTVDDAARRHSSNIKWNRELGKNLQRQKETEYDQGFIRRAAYRPFVASNCYTDYTFIQMKYQMDRIFPGGSSENRMICVPGKGLKNLFSVIMIDTMSDLNLTEAGAQCFPRYCYQETSGGIESYGRTSRD